MSSRFGLHRCLIRSGWRPPVQVERRLAEDEVLLGEPLGPAGG